MPLKLFYDLAPHPTRLKALGARKDGDVFLELKWSHSDNVAFMDVTRNHDVYQTDVTCLLKSSSLNIIRWCHSFKQINLKTSPMSNTVTDYVIVVVSKAVS